MDPNRLRPRSGTILVWVVVLMVLLTATMYAAYEAAARARDSIESQLEFSGQAMNIARAGVADSLSWFRRQTTQPVTTFAPVLNLGANPPINETDDPTIGLVRSLEVSSQAQVWARYEVRSSKVVDATALRGLPGAGTVWQVESDGYIYKNLDATKPYNQLPNRVLASVRLATELRRMVIVLPAPSATCTASPSSANFNAKTKVIGGSGMGCVYPMGAGAPTISGTITGTPAQSTASPYNGAIANVFGVSDPTLRSLADTYTTDPTTITSPLPADKLIYVNGNIVFDVTRPLAGTAILVVNGNLTVNASTDCYFDGLLYVNGSCTINAPALLRGSIITNGALILSGVGDYVEVDYDSSILQQLLHAVGQYRYSRPISVLP